jgi:tetratricopeptide (TPR) repeat protein
VDAVMKLAPETAKLAAALSAKPQPSDASLVENWKARVGFGKEVGAYAEYSLSAMAATADSAKAVELVDLLIDVNPKSQYLSSATPVYLAALVKNGGAAKQLAGAQKVLKGSPANEDALYALASGYMASAPAQAQNYATRLTATMRTKAKPEGMSAEDWDRKKAQYMGQGYYIAGAAAAQTSSWKDCDTNLRAALPYVGSNPGISGTIYFYLGLANYQLGKLTGDRPKMQEGQKFSEQSAAIAGPMQTQAQRNAALIKQELGAPLVRR